MKYKSNCTRCKVPIEYVSISFFEDKYDHMCNSCWKFYLYRKIVLVIISIPMLIYCGIKHNECIRLATTHIIFDFGILIFGIICFLSILNILLQLDSGTGGGSTFGDM